MRVINKQRCSNRSQRSVGCVEESVGGCVILRTYPFAFQHTPESLCDVEMRRIGRQVEKEEPPAFPNGSHLLEGAAAVDACVVKHDDNVSCFRAEGQAVEEVRHHVGGYAPLRGEALVAVVPGRHSEDVEPGNLLGWYPPHGTASRKARSLLCRCGSRRRRRGLSSRLRPSVQVLAASRPCIHRAAARAFPLGVSLYAYILRQCC